MDPLKLPDLNHYLALFVLAEHPQEQLPLQVFTTATNLHYGNTNLFPTSCPSMGTKKSQLQMLTFKAGKEALSTWIISVTQFSYQH